MMCTISELRDIEDSCQALELWLYGHKKEVDEKRLESYEIFRRISELREREKKERSSLRGAGAQK